MIKWPLRKMFESGVASCDLCGGQGAVDHLFDACLVWRAVCDLEPPTPRVALSDASKIIPHMTAFSDPHD